MLDIVLITNYAVALGISLFVFVEHRRSNIPIALATISLLVPVAGIVIAILAVSTIKRNPDDDISRFDEVIELQGQSGEMLMSVNLNKEINVIPLEEALVVNDHRTRRRVVLDALKDESHEIIPLLAKASQNEDTETSHYAVAALMELKRVMMSDLQKQTVAYEFHANEADKLIEIANVLKHYLGSGLMDPRMENTYRKFQSDVLGSLIELGECGEEQYEDKVECELMLGRYDKARDASEAFLAEHPNAESAYYVQLKLWFMIRSGVRFNQTLAALKQSPVAVSQRTLQLIRYWYAGVQHV